MLDAETEFADPARTPTTLETVVGGIVVPCHILLPMANRAVLRWASELTREGVGTHRLGADIAGRETPHMLPPNDWVLSGKRWQWPSLSDREGRDAANMQTVVTSEKVGKKWLERQQLARKGWQEVARIGKWKPTQLPSCSPGNYRHTDICPQYGRATRRWNATRYTQTKTLYTL